MGLTDTAQPEADKAADGHEQRSAAPLNLLLCHVDSSASLMLCRPASAGPIAGRSSAVGGPAQRSANA
jgi:hypothetical protein